MWSREAWAAAADKRLSQLIVFVSWFQETPEDAPGKINYDRFLTESFRNP